MQDLARSLSVVLCLLGCTGELSVLGGPDGGSSPPDAGPVVEAAVGLDDRPANPTCIAPEAPPAGEVAVELVEAFPDLVGLASPLFLLEEPGRRDRWFGIARRGEVWRWTGTGADAAVLQAVPVDTAGEGGLLGFAFHPEYEANRTVFLSTTESDDGFRSRIRRGTVSEDGIDVEAEPLLDVAQPFLNHNGGWIGFGPDGLLYVVLGDGGAGNDPERNGQDTDTLLGAILRVDVDRTEGPLPYGIPPDNPFADGVGGAPEIYAWGLRNPWRVSFDPATGRLFAGDVGQRTREEISLITRGANYGWPCREGFGEFLVDRADCADSGPYTPPIADYGRDEGVSVTGGYVYRGSDIPALAGRYVFGDFGTGNVWALTEQEDGAFTRQRLLATGRNIASFAQDQDGELYVLDINGPILRLASTTAPPPNPLPQRLSETGCMDPADPSRPGPMLIPYAPSATLWSDGAGKERWFAIPDGTRVTVDDQGDFQFPAGSMLVKQFRRDDRLLETRFYMRHPDGQWGGYSYRWNDAQTDAFLVPDAATVEAGGRTWNIPSRAQCQQCHTEVAGRSLGLEVAQLSRPFVYPDPDGGPSRRADQLATLAHIGVLEAPPEDPPALPAYDDADASVEDRARAYLHSNCAPCHQPGGPGRGAIDLRWFTPLAESGMCDAPIVGDLGLEDARVLRPGAPESSLLSWRMRATDGNRMPQVGTVIVDPVGTALVDAWIDALTACE
jgi:uncharacterized repeat protein (TIGR03806 family)